MSLDYRIPPSKVLDTLTDEDIMLYVAFRQAEIAWQKEAERDADLTQRATENRRKYGD